jgi:hypothetical protein
LLQARRFNIEDYPQIKSWGLERRALYTDPTLLPDCGFIVDGYAACFLYTTDSSVCYLDNLIAVSEKSHSREMAIKLVIDAVIEEAKFLGFKVIFSCTNNPKVIERAMILGAKVSTNYVLLQLPLPDPNPIEERLCQSQPHK